LTHLPGLTVSSVSTDLYTELLGALLDRHELTEQQIRALMEALLGDHWGELEVAAVLIALRMKGETAGEIAAAASVLRERMTPFVGGTRDVLDTCGTGGKQRATFNISTAAALVAAGAGVPVVKHGNRAATGRSGSADVLAALGLSLDGDIALARRCLDEAGLAFCFAPYFHSALKHLAPLRKRLGTPTLFNWLGPLANPAKAGYQLLGVSRQEMREPMGQALWRLGTRHALIVGAEDGMDEVSLAAPTDVWRVRADGISTWRWTARDFGLEPCTVEELQVADPQESACRIRDVLEGGDGPATRIVLANAAAALIAAERVSTPQEGVDLARASIQSGSARRVLNRLVACHHERHEIVH
jgi:anthranilate phosphoribosyltransferase